MDEHSRYQRVDLCHYGIAQRWLVVYSKAAWERAEKTLAKAQMFHLQAKRFESEQAAQAALEDLARSLRSHTIERFTLTRHIQYARRGETHAHHPRQGHPVANRSHRGVGSSEDHPRPAAHSLFCAGHQYPRPPLSDVEVIEGYKGQNAVERGVGFLKGPVFFVSSLFVKKPSRIQGLLLVMTLALLVYSGAQRRVRNQLEQEGETLPNQIGQPTSRPTLRWLFQLLEGINRVVFYVQGHVQVVIEGLTELRRKILRLFGPRACQTYQISSA